MIRGKNVNLRAVNLSDLPRILEWVNDPDLRVLMGTVYPVSDIEHEDWFRRQILSGTNRYFVIEYGATPEPIGLCTLKNFDNKNRKVELAVYVGPAGMRGRGLGGEAIRLLLEFVFKELNFHRVYLYAAEFNDRAIRVYESIGFTREGIEREAVFHAGRYWDTVRLGILDREFRNNA